MKRGGSALPVAPSARRRAPSPPSSVATAARCRGGLPAPGPATPARRAIGVRGDSPSRCTILACRTPPRSSRRRRRSSNTRQSRRLRNAEAEERDGRPHREGGRRGHVVIDRPERRNAVDAQTARELALGQELRRSAALRGGAGRHGAPPRERTLTHA